LVQDKLKVELKIRKSRTKEVGRGRENRESGRVTYQLRRLCNIYLH